MVREYPADIRDRVLKARAVLGLNNTRAVIRRYASDGESRYLNDVPDNQLEACIAELEREAGITPKEKPLMEQKQQTSVFDTGISPAQAERLHKLTEECGELISIINKTLRHGMESYHPDDEYRTPNRNLIENEIGDVLIAVGLMIQCNDVDVSRIEVAADRGKEAAKIWMHHPENHVDF